MKTLSAGHRRTAIAALLTAAAFLATPAANAASPPGTPHVTVGADIKQLIFDWGDVAGAAYYRLLKQVGTGAFNPVIDNIPASTTQARLSIAVHLQNWANTRYVVAACNTSGCSNSASVLPKNLMLDSIAYIKASNTDPGDRFGHTVALSDDGKTLAVFATGEDSNATGVNGNQADNSSPNSRAVYVFHRASSGWRQEAYIKAPLNVSEPFQSDLTDSNDETALAMNANGTLLAVGLAVQGGVVYIYQKPSSGSWSLVQTLESPNGPGDRDFGSSVEMSVDGRTLKVNSASAFTHIYVRPHTTWQHSVSLTSFFGDICLTTRLSGDGNTLVSSCFNLEPPRVFHVETRKRSGNTWTHVSDVPVDSGGSLTLDFDASTMALQEIVSTIQTVTRTVGVFHWTGSTWVPLARLPAPPAASLPSNSFDDFGQALAFNRTGNLLAIGDPGAFESGSGVSPVSTLGTVPRGAVYVWQRDDRNPTTWTMRSAVRSPNPDFFDLFGRSIAFCGTGNTLAVSAEGEDSKAKGIDGDRSDPSAREAGAAYLY